MSMNDPRHDALERLEYHDEFIWRHIGPDEQETADMLAEVGAESLDDLVSQIIPARIRLPEPLGIGEPVSEAEALARLKKIAAKNVINKSYIGMGYHPTHVPKVIQRNVLENPGWYTAYTPYQPEIAQGRLEAILNFQQMTMDLAGLPLASASLLDEATAAAEAMAMARRVAKSKSNVFAVDSAVFPQTIDVVRTRAQGLGIDLVVADRKELASIDAFGVLLQYPDATGDVVDWRDVAEAVHERKGIVTVASDLMALMLLQAPGHWGADIVFGNSQRFGVPMAYGGPHAAFFATRDEFKRAMPGRIIGVSRDAQGQPALRMAMQTREQHIRREKATSNICTSQVLLANMAGFYAVYHGPRGLRRIATRIHRLTQLLASAAESAGLQRLNKSFFDTLTFAVNEQRDDIIQRALLKGVNLRIDANGTLGVSLHELTTLDDVAELAEILTGQTPERDWRADDAQLAEKGTLGFDESMLRTDPVLTHPVFNSYHSETEMMRYLRKLEGRDLTLNHSMISLGSCTMKLNAAAEMIPISWPEFAELHPFVPREQARGYEELIADLEKMLVAITGYDAICMQPNSGAQGEYAGLMTIRRYLDAQGESHRNICLIPASAHGTNPASAALAGMRVVVVKCDADGNIDMEDLREKAESVADQLACIMVTYPSTHGVYEENIREVCEIIHRCGGQVYMDGANMNAQVGLTSPGYIGSDVSHLNLHKTFAIPHGGGGPGMGPIGVKSHLAPYVPNHPVVRLRGRSIEGGSVSAAPFGSAGILPISWMYLVMTGGRGQTLATQYALLNANYLAKKLGEHFPVLYKGRNDRVAHECILDLRPLKAETGISEVDIAKRLMDYGFHAPTMSFPVPGTFMIEPTESESKAELDRFIRAMVQIREEIDKVARGEWDAEDNPLKHAPHTAEVLLSDNWSRAYSREVAAYPVPEVRHHKFWPSVGRIDDVYGDRNLVCSCPPIEAYE
jgi:glycine dehydrogenase